MRFFQKIQERQRHGKTALCVGLDPHPEKFPSGFDGSEKGVYSFLMSVVRATGASACAFKPQIAYFSALGLESVLQSLIADIHSEFPHVPVILDAKRGDIGSTAEMYAREAFERYRADAVTVNPYMGQDTVAPFASYKDKAVFLLCRTSNPGAHGTQNVKLEDGRPYFEFLAQEAFGQWNQNRNLGLVVGATAEAELARLRDVCPEAWFLVPGVGAQGGSLKAVMAVGQRAKESSEASSDRGGVIVNSSRGILYAGTGSDFADRSREEAEKLVAVMGEFL